MWNASVRILLLIGLTTVGFAKPAELTTHRFRGATIDVVTCEPRALRLVWKDPAGQPHLTFSAALKAVGGDVAAITNAGIFGVLQDGSPYPLGLHVEGGTLLRPVNLRDGSGNFYLKPNGMFWVDAAGKAHVDEAHAFVEGKRAGVVLATQSGPLLLSKGQLHPSFSENSASRKIRNGIGACGTSAVIAVSRDGINFWDFATFFRDVLKCGDALYLDGTISRLHAPKLALSADAGPFAGMLVVTDGLRSGRGARGPRRTLR